MPEMKFDIRWPDGATTRCYSPSLIVGELLEAKDYPLFEFVERVRAALKIGSERVRLKFGFYCSAAEDQLLEIETKAGNFSGEAVVSVTGLYPAGTALPPLPHPTAAASSVVSEVSE